MSTTTLQALCRANLGILRQKLVLMDAMKTKFGAVEAKSLYAKVCPIVQASVGQHIRHSMDHMELATNVAAEAAAATTTTSSDSSSTDRELHYDLRQRGGGDENDIEEARNRIERAVERLHTILESPPSSSSSSEDRHVRAYFMLSGDPEEFNLPSTVEREMGFAAHHAIHHMAMVKIIVQTTLGISDDVPTDFGKAPSTTVYDNTNMEAKNNPHSP
jgi:hypothetical protein